MPQRPSVRAVGGLSVGLAFGLVCGWLAGLLRSPRQVPGTVRA